MNKYQEAKDFILRTLNDQYDGTLKQKIEALDILQELIDNYIELMNEKCMKCRDFQLITRIDPLTILCKEKGCKWYDR